MLLTLLYNHPYSGAYSQQWEDEEGTKIGTSLPEELTVGKGIVTENGIVVYQTDKDVDVCIQSITGQQDGIPLEGARGF